MSKRVFVFLIKITFLLAALALFSLAQSALDGIGSRPGNTFGPAVLAQQAGNPDIRLEKGGGGLIFPPPGTRDEALRAIFFLLLWILVIELLWYLWAKRLFPGNFGALTVVLQAALVIFFFAALEHNLDRYVDTHHQKLFKPHSLRMWQLNPRVHLPGFPINSYGFRGDDFPVRKEPGEIRIFALGDSTTFGAGVTQNETYPYYLEEDLEKMYPKTPIRVVNAGVPGYSSYQGLILLKEMLVPLGADIIIYGYHFGDYGVEEMEDKMRNPQNPLGKNFKMLMQSSMIYMWLRRELKIGNWAEYDNEGKKLRRSVTRVTDEDTEKNIIETLKVCKKRHINVVFLLPARGREKGEKSAKGKIVERIAHEGAYPFVDMTVLWKYEDRPRYLLDNLHPNPLGNRFIARSLAATLEKTGWIK